jgi:hypothetical protein
VGSRENISLPDTAQRTFEVEVSLIEARRQRIAAPEFQAEEKIDVVRALQDRRHWTPQELQPCQQYHRFAWSIGQTGDTYKTNEWLDNVLVSYNGYLVRAASSTPTDTI